MKKGFRFIYKYSQNIVDFLFYGYTLFYCFFYKTYTGVWLNLFFIFLGIFLGYKYAYLSYKKLNKDKE